MQVSKYITIFREVSENFWRKTTKNAKRRKQNMCLLICYSTVPEATHRMTLKLNYNVALNTELCEKYHILSCLVYVGWQCSVRQRKLSLMAALIIQIILFHISPKQATVLTIHGFRHGGRDSLVAVMREWLFTASASYGKPKLITM